MQQVCLLSWHGYSTPYSLSHGGSPLADGKDAETVPSDLGDGSWKQDAGTAGDNWGQASNGFKADASSGFGNGYEDDAGGFGEAIGAGDDNGNEACRK